MNENELIKQRFIDLSNRAFDKGYQTYTGFLNLDEISKLKEQKYKTPFFLFGGFANAERCVACFSEYDNVAFPIVCIKVEPLQQKFADKLNHRDFLGSLMNLGIDRSVLGDIKIDNNVGYVFCLDSIADYLIENLTRIKHTSVKCCKNNEIPEFITKLPDESQIIVSSLRADTIVAGIYKLSRNNVSQLFLQDKVFINSKAIKKEGTLIKENDVVSVRGYGKFIYSGTEKSTKKGRYVICVRIYK